MENLYEKLMKLDDSEIERIEREEARLLKTICAKKLHEFDNVAISESGELYALEDIPSGADVIKNGNVFMKAKKDLKRGEKMM